MGGYILKVNSRTIRRATQFHGHLGPWLVLGLRAGSYARRRLRASPFHLTALVNCPASPPHSCFLDGIQLGSGCTMGKANIQHRPVNGCCRVLFTATEGRKSVPRCQLALELLPALWDELCSALGAPSSARHLARLARDIGRRPIGQLFAISETGTAGNSLNK
ncbi:MAG: formylmethanofuran dehydrogenase subunit E family protein [candidate division WOR-3 bacterium]